MNEQNNDFLDTIRQVVDILEVVGERISLKKRGNSYLALCPFHNDKKPSLNISTQKQIYKCFSCGAGGDAIRFVMEYDNLSFWETLKLLAGKYGIPIPSQAHSPSSYKDPWEKEKEIYHHAQVFYHQVLLQHKQGEKAREYLKKRGIPAKIIETFALGYSPHHSSFNLKNYLKNLKKWDEKMIEHCGLFSHNKDFLSGRVIFPIRNEKGHTLAFGGRTLDNFGPKYLNTAEQPWFEKGKTLYGLYENYQRMGKKTAAIVEGYFDVIACYLCDIPSISPMGTAFTDHQLAKLTRYNRDKKIIVLFDGDAAGQRASLKVAELFVQKEIDGEVIHLPEGDPYDFFFQHGAKGEKKLEEYAMNVYDYVITQQSPGPSASPVKKKEALKNMMALIDKMPQGIVRDDFATKIGKHLHIDAAKALSELRLEFSQWRQQKSQQPQQMKKKSVHLPFYQETEFSFIIFLLCNPPYIAQATSLISLNLIHHPFSRYVYNIFCRIAEKKDLTFQNILDEIENKNIRDYLEKKIFLLEKPQKIPLSLDEMIKIIIKIADEKSAKDKNVMGCITEELRTAQFSEEAGISSEQKEKYEHKKEEQLIERITNLRLCYIYDFIQWLKKNDEEILYSDAKKHFLIKNQNTPFIEKTNEQTPTSEDFLMAEIMRISEEKKILKEFYQ